MYCINCGVKLADSEKKCPLCGTTVYHPEIERPESRPLYPSKRMPKSTSGPHTLDGVVIVLFLIPMVVCFFADYLFDGKLNWFGYVAGALVTAYVIIALPMWFENPNPVIFVPCDFAAIALYLLYIDLITGGEWFMSFAFPVTGGLCVITCAVVTLLRYVRRGRLYIFGGAFIALGLFMLLVEFLIGITFDKAFIGWSVYPLVVLVLCGGLMIFLAINSDARETLERKLFF